MDEHDRECLAYWREVQGGRLVTKAAPRDREDPAPVLDAAEQRRADRERLIANGDTWSRQARGL